MRMVTGYLPPSHGSVSIDGQDLLKTSDRRQATPRVPPRESSALPRTDDSTVPELRRGHQGRAARAPGSRSRSRNRSREPARGRRRSVSSTLSKGFKQRVGLAQAIVHEPAVLILDEPTSSLDPKQRVEVRDLIVALRGEHTVVLSTHILPEVSQVTDRVVIINRGRVMAVDSPNNLSQRLRGREEVTVEVGGAAVEDLRERAVLRCPGVDGVHVDEPCRRRRHGEDRERARHGRPRGSGPCAGGALAVAGAAQRVAVARRNLLEADVRSGAGRSGEQDPPYEPSGGPETD